MTFELWLFTIKRLGQTMDVAKMIFDNLTKEEQDKIRAEYDEYLNS